MSLKDVIAKDGEGKEGKGPPGKQIVDEWREGETKDWGINESIKD